jgi:sulfoxide reductase catalytic subunit YedY
LSYFGVVFVLAPLAIMTGLSMSPAFTGRFTWYAKVPANRQVGRSIHFLIMCTFVLFIIAHVAMVAISGLVRNMNHIVMDTDDANPVGLYLGLMGVATVVAVNALANWAAWKRPRVVQNLSKAIVTPVMRLLFDRAVPVAQFPREAIAPFFWVNGKMPTSDEWKTLASGDFKSYRLKVYGLVENPVELSLDELRGMGEETQITLHHCIQGWSGVAEWGGLPMLELVRLVRPKPGARAPSSSIPLAKAPRAASFTTAWLWKTRCTGKPYWLMK